jgi:hypothetical protein
MLWMPGMWVEADQPPVNEEAAIRQGGLQEIEAIYCCGK